MGKKSKRMKPKRLKKLLKAKSKRLVTLIREAPKGLLDLEEFKVRVHEIDVIKKRISNAGKSYFQRMDTERKVEIAELRAEAEELRRLYHPHLREINQKFLERFISKVAHCPNCGEPDYGNKMNGKPFCFKCQIPFSGTKHKGFKVLKPRYNGSSIFKPLEVF